MAQEQNQHLTTEQLSALLDTQLPAQEQARAEAHLRTCQQCQAMLNDLRHTVALLHALPPPVLPRSFVLSPEMLRAATPAEEPATAIPITIQLEERRRRRQHGQGTSARRQRGQLSRHILPRTLRAMSTLVAVLGLLFVLSAIPFHLGGAGSASNGSSYAPNSSTTSGSASSTQKSQNTVTTNQTPGAGKNALPSTTTTPTPEPQATATPSQTDTHHLSTTSDTAVAQWFSLFSPGGRAIDGLLLLVLAGLGLLLARWWRVRQT